VKFAGLYRIIMLQYTASKNVILYRVWCISDRATWTDYIL